ncbi:MAG: glycosyltransferase [Pirellulales bacterium]
MHTIDEAPIDPRLDTRAASRARTQPIPVLHVINGEHYAGAERVQDLLALRLGELGFGVGFACLKAGEFLRVRRARSARVHDLRMLGRFDFGPAWELAAIVRSEGYGLLHAHTPRSAMIAAVASLLAGVPMVYHVHSPVAHDTTHWLKNLLNGVVERWSMRRAMALIAVSESLGRRMCRRRGVAPKVCVVPNGVPSRESARREDSDHPETTLAVVALFRPRKGIEVLLEALARLRASGHAVRLRAVGGFETPEYESRMRALAGELNVADAIEWVGFTDDVDAELARADVLVLPSLFGEGLPMVVLEAMSAGLPVVATRVEGVPEAVRDGVDGVIAEPGSAASLAAAVGRILSGELDRAQLGRSAAARHAEHFSDRAMARGVAEVYRRILDGHPPLAVGRQA